MNNIQVFENKQFESIRTMMMDNEPWFAGNDVAHDLGYIRPRKAVMDHVEDEDKMLITPQSLTSQNRTLDNPDAIVPNRGLVMINKVGLFSLISASNFSQTKDFKRWITSEVLPSLKNNMSKNIDNKGITTYSNPLFGSIRTAGNIENPTFCLIDLCNALGLENVSMVKARLNKDGVSSTEVIDNLGRKQMATFVDEGNMYMCIFQSRKDNAKAFQRWVTSEVLPSIRKTGSYSANVPQSFAEALQLAADQQRQIEQQQKQLAEQKPKVEFFNTVAESKTAIEMKEVANVLDFDKVGRNKLFQILRDNHLLTRKNQPYQKYIECGYFRTIEQKWERPDGDIVISIKTLVYQQGVEYIRKLLLKLGYKPHKKEE